MRRKISLYIADRLVDLDNQSLVLLNYTMEDMTNPTIVKNSYSQQITIKGTPNNNKIFGDIYRSDRVTQYGSDQTGIYFDPTRKTPFKIFNELGEVLESGYCKLDKFTKDKEYTISLFGGLGAFFYALSYDEQGNKRSLADLKYTKGDAQPSELDFTINRDTIFSAWGGLTSGSGGKITPLLTYDNRYVDSSGVPHNATGYKMCVFDVTNVTSVLLTGISDSNCPLAVCLGQYGDILAVYGTGTQSYDDFAATLPSGAYTLRINGSVSVTPMVKTPSSIWDIINFAPAYNGYPTGSFDANKAIVNAENAGLALPAGAKTMNGYVLVNLPQKYTEWETKDLRSYLQRPVIKVSRIIDAICSPVNNGGYRVNLDSDFFNENNPYYAKTWMTLPLIQTLNLQETGGSGFLNPGVSFIYIPGGGNVTTLYNVNLEVTPKISIASSGNMYMDTRETNGQGYYMNYLRYIAIAHDGQGNIIETRQVLVCSRQSPISEDDIPRMDIVGHFDSMGKWVGSPISFTFSQFGIDYVELMEEVVGVRWGINPSNVPPTTYLWNSQTNYMTYVMTSGYQREYEVAKNTYSYTSASTARTGAHITKADLLSTGKTPAEYLLGFTKMFGLIYSYDKVDKVITISQRKNFYKDEVVDLTRRVNLSKTPSFLPYGFDSKWYNFGVDYNEGEYASYYEKVYGRRFGLQKVNTGYGFNADSKEVLSNIAYNGACQVLEASNKFIDIKRGDTLVPSVFQDGGATYSVIKQSSTEEINVPPLGDAVTRTWLNPQNKTYDLFAKPQFHREENAPYDERDTIIFFDGMKSLIGVTNRYAVTDDNMVMMSLNDNTPCWIFDYQALDNISLVTSIPMFSRYLMSGGSVTHSLDMGTPFEVSIPGVTFGDGSSIYERYWQSYIADRYDDDSRVMICRVNLSGLQVNEDLFRSFYWYDGAIWALNKIINHSLTTYDDTDCEFIKVQDIQNYIG